MVADKGRCHNDAVGRTPQGVVLGTKTVMEVGSRGGDDGIAPKDTGLV